MTSSKLEQELEAIRTGAAIYPLTDRAFLRITGSDATRWLNGMVTNSIQSLQPGEGNYNFLLNAQGRIQADCTIYRDPTADPIEYLLESDKSQISTIQQLLDHFIIMDDVELSPLEKSGIAIIGPKAFHTLAQLALGDNEEVLAAAAASPAGAFRTGLLGNEALALIPPSQATPIYEVWFPTEAQANHLRDQLQALGAPEISPETLEAHRILSATPKFGQDIRDRDLPQETAQTHALHFAKGCYLGQEIVERIRSRGQVHRTFTAFTLTGQLPELPATLEANGKPAGELTSAIQIGDTLHALGYLRREAATQPLTYPGGTATPRVAS
jgi:folate-binding protein YgfZ